MSRRWFWGILFVAMLVVLLSVLSSTASAAQQARLAEETIAAINAWRMQQGRWPLRPNATLQELALFQAQYVASLPSVPDGVAVHVGRRGEGPKERALWSPFDWPTYGRPDRIALEEIAFAGRSLDGAMNFWQHSTPHTAASLNEAYREIGVAVLPHRMGYVFVAVLAGRPGVLPVLVNPQTKQLYLTNERYWGANTGGAIQEASRVRLLDGRGRPFGGWLPWQPVLPLPETSDDVIFVEYTDGTTQTITTVSLTGDVARLPGLLATPTPVPPTATVTPGPSPTPSPSVLLIYDARSLWLINISSRALNLGGVELVGNGARVSAMRWDAPGMVVSIYNFPAGDCLSLTLPGVGEPARPSICRARQGWSTVKAGEDFWARGDFEVYLNGRSVAMCMAAAGSCAFPLP